MIRKDVQLEVLNGPWLGESECFLAGKSDGVALRGEDGVMVRWPERGYHSVKQTGPGLVNVRIGCWVGSVDDRMLGGSETKVVGAYVPRRL